MTDSYKDGFDVIIIGGGITGAGAARDCAMRGLKVLLIERHDIATGATGRNHGLLHSGARYAVTDQASAEECIRENKILRRIASFCVEQTDGFALTLPEDDLSYQSRFVQACKAAGIHAEAIDPKEAIRLEPSVNKDIIGAVRVPDASVDPFRLCAANMLDAKLRGAVILVYTEVTGILRERDTVLGVKVIDHTTGEESEYHAPLTLNAGGIWGHRIAALAGVNINMFPAKGSHLIFARRVNKMVLNRCRKPANADILVPTDRVSIIGTTSARVTYSECDHMQVTPEEVDFLLAEGSKLAPVLANTRILRAYAGVRPLVSADNDPSGRNISRGIVLLDHESRDGLKGFVSITGGKLTTYRLMAEQAADLICKKLNVRRSCKTAVTPLPGSETGSFKELVKKLWAGPSTLQKASAEQAGSPDRDPHFEDSMICGCEGVSAGEVDTAIRHLDVHTLTDLRRRTRMGMGICQGELCACRSAELLARSHGCVPRAKNDLRDFLTERWKGMFPIGWGDTLRESDYTQWVYNQVLGINED